MSWTKKHDKNLSYSNHCCHGNDFWRVFERQCHVVGLINFDVAITDKWYWALCCKLTHHQIKANKLCVRENPSYYHIVLKIQ